MKPSISRPASSASAASRRASSAACTSIARRRCSAQSVMHPVSQMGPSMEPVTGVVASAEVSQLLDELTRMTGREDPYPRYARLREIAPIVRADDGALVATRYADCAAMVRDPRLGHISADALGFVGLPDWEEHPALRTLFTSMLTINPPDHTRLRRLVSSTFTARRVQALRPAIAAMVDGLLDRMDGSLDFVQAFAFPLPVNV